MFTNYPISIGLIVDGSIRDIRLREMSRLRKPDSVPQKRVEGKKLKGGKIKNNFVFF